MTRTLAEIVFDFAGKTVSIPENILNNEGWSWDAYAGIRYGFLHLALELRKLAASIGEKRVQNGKPLTRAQKLLAQHQVAFRDFQALLIGLDDTFLDRVPKPGEWTLRTILWHVHVAERYFFSHILNALDNNEPKPLSREQIDAILGTARPDSSGTLVEMWKTYNQLHGQVISQLSTLTTDELQTLSPMWEPEAVAVEFRMLRFTAHIREHTNQLEKALTLLDPRPNESKMLLRQLYAALAEAEGEMIGAEDECVELCRQTGRQMEQRIKTMLEAVNQAGTIIKAYETGDLHTIKNIITYNKGWAHTQMSDGLSALVFAQYQGNRPMVELLRSALNELSLFEAAMVGDIQEVDAWITAQPDMINSFAGDGFTALQLASYFGQPDVVKRLLDAGANVHVRSQNQMNIQPIHAAVASRNLESVKLLIAAGADVNAQQQDNFTPLMAALQNTDEEIRRVLLEAGAS